MEEQQKTWIYGGIAVVLVLLLVCTCCTCGGLAFWAFAASNPQPYPTPDLDFEWDITPEPDYEWDVTPEPGETPTGPDNPPATPAPPTTGPIPDEAAETLAALDTAIIPDSDLHELGIRFLGVDPNTSRTRSEPNPDYPVGTRRVFYASDVDNDEQFEVTAVLVYKTEHIYMWVEEGANVNEKRIREAADLFEEHTYPTNREFFGTEWTPGVDNDPHLSVLHAYGLGSTVAGYFSSADSYVQEVRSDSNEMEMFYIHLGNNTIGNDFYNGVLAHEFQHMIHWYNDKNEDTWINEGCSELAMELNNRAHPGGHYDVGGSEYSYLLDPDTQLTTWPEGTAGDASAHYGGAYLFMSYFLERFGEDATKALVSHDENGMRSVDAVLQEDLELSFSHKDIFADWIIANLLDTPQVGEGQYDYSEIDVSSPRMDKTYSTSNYPADRRGTVRQYGVDYVEVNSSQPLRFTFTGASQAKLMDTDAHSGQYLWWSNRSDESDARLTRIVDLTGASSAELQFWSWYHIEEDWDYAYVVVGTSDSGVITAEDVSNPEKAKYLHWSILDDSGLKCTTANPNNNNFGCGLTGESGRWTQLKADLSDYAGQQIAVRFEYITDAAVNQSGFALDDVEIVVDGQTVFADDMENATTDGWIAEGFVRHANVLPQEWIVQLVTYGDETEVQRLLMADGVSGEWVIPFSAQMDKAVITISALAPVTTESAKYQFALEQE
ncbi:MAG TPA: immune inhibitor A [Anaerolineae bacterium]|nr:immune inhibitor A [Anaerolineae bacterium]